MKKQRGATLVELLVASLIGLIALGTIGSIFLSGQKIAKERSLELLLTQNINSTLQVLKEDLQRAGFDNYQMQTLKLSGATHTLQLNGPNTVAFSYYRPDQPAAEAYRALAYKKSGEKLLLCEQYFAKKELLPTYNNVGSCDSLLDEEIIKVTDFRVLMTDLQVGSIKTRQAEITLTAGIPSASLSKSSTIVLKQRNWQ